MIVVSDTSCLCYLALLGREGLLQSLYGQVFIPPAVAAELARGAVELPPIQRVLEAGWLTVRSLNAPARAAELEAEIDHGEAEAIVLCEELHADFLLVDDQAARNLAKKRGIAHIGLLGVLVSAQRASLLGGALKPAFEELLHLGFRASPALIETLLKEVGE